MLRWAALLGFAGLICATAVIVWSGWDLVLQALAEAGWGILFVALFHLIPLGLSSASWRVLAPGRNRPSYSQFAFYMLVRAAVNNLMPVARIGGEIASVRLMTAQGMRQSTAIAITIVELTLSVAAVFLFIATGILLFALRVNDHNIVMQLIWGLALSLPILVALAAVQKIGFFGLMSRLFNKVFRDKWAKKAGGAARLDRAVATVYRRKGRVLTCFLMQVVCWSLGSVEIWMALYFLGHSLPMAEAVMIEALIQATSSAAFAIPGALGVQEAGFIVFGGMLGLPHETAAALAVIRRCRDLICYAPGLVMWQMHEGRKLFRS